MIEKVDIVIATYNRCDVIIETINNVLNTCSNFNQLIVVDNASTDGTKEVLEDVDDERIEVVFNKENLGAAGGKNVGLRRSNAEVIIVIDDDAIFDSEDPILNVKKIFNEDSNLGIIQFKIVNYQTRKVLRYEFPGDNPERDQDDVFNIGYFIGAGHAIRRSMLVDVGFYPDNFGLYAHEEIDLSYRAINGGYLLKYYPFVTVLHKKAPGGRMPVGEVIGQLLLNRMIMSHKYLPTWYKWVNNFLWLIKSTIDSKSPMLIFNVIRKYRESKLNHQRSIMSKEAMKYLKDFNGRIYR